MTLFDIAFLSVNTASLQRKITRVQRIDNSDQILLIVRRGRRSPFSIDPIRLNSGRGSSSHAQTYIPREEKGGILWKCTSYAMHIQIGEVKILAVGEVIGLCRFWRPRAAWQGSTSFTSLSTHHSLKRKRKRRPSLLSSLSRADITIEARV